jgi:hypothetical protein
MGGGGGEGRGGVPGPSTWLNNSAWSKQFSKIKYIGRKESALNDQIIVDRLSLNCVDYSRQQKVEQWSLPSRFFSIWQIIQVYLCLRVADP